MRAVFRAVFPIVLALALWGCSGRAVRPIDPAERFVELERNALNSDSPSLRTALYLRNHDLTQTWEREPFALLKRLDAERRSSGQARLLPIIAELAYLHAEEVSDPSEKARLYLWCAVNAHAAMFPKEQNATSPALDPTAGLSTKFYNQALSRYIQLARDAGVKHPQGALVPLPAGGLRIESRSTEFAWKPEAFDSFFLAYEFKSERLAAENITPGVGIPLIVQATTPFLKVAPDGERPTIKQAYAATLFLRIEERGAGAGGEPEYAASIELYDPMKSDSVTVNGRRAPLETDLTTPLAFMLDKIPPPKPIEALFKPELWRGAQGLFMLQPYDPEKIPVVFVHGLMSSPLTWADMLNGVIGDPEIRKRCQFWFFKYPTGNPVLFSASLLRESLKSAQREFDPKGTDPNFNRMVLVGHSMGGLLVKGMVQSSGEAFWHNVTDKSFAEIGLVGEDRAFAERVFFFEPLSFVSRALFLAVPHRGSNMAVGRLVEFAASLITLPFELVRGGAWLFTAALRGMDAEDGRRSMPRRLPTGVDNLAPHSPFIRAQTSLPIKPGLPYHSIIGNESGPDRTGGSDGIVPYESSHLEHALSEKIVHYGHSVQEHPLTVLEVRRILREHIRNGDAGQAAKGR